MTDKPNILVVGGAGFIGSHTVLALQAAGFRVIVFDNLSTGHRDAVFGDVFIRGELGDRARLTGVMTEHLVEAVVHLAAISDARQSVSVPLTFYRNNVVSSLSLMEAMHYAGVRKLVFSSTAAIYGNHETADRLAETAPRRPVNPYGQSKAMVETMLETAVQAHGVQAVCLRYFNAAGADPHRRTGERHDPETHLIPLVMQAAVGHRDRVTIYGTDYPTPDGTCIRDYVHVSDLAGGHVAALRFLLAQAQPCFHAINLGTGVGHSIRDVIQAVESVSGRSVKTVEAARRQGDAAALVADPSLAAALLNWRAERAELREIVRDAWEFFTRSLDG